MRRFRDFIRNEDRGSATLWNLFWLLGVGMLLGLGIDTTAAMNTKARLQIVADAAAHAGAIDIFPVATDAVATAIVYGHDNIPDHQGVVTTADVTIGHWDRATRSFETDNIPNYNAVRVVAGRDSLRGNALKTSLLKIVGLANWDIRARATALYYDDMSLVDRCRKDGLLAGGTMEQTSNNAIIGDYCMHGEAGLKISSNNVVTCGVELSTADPSLWLNQAVKTPSGDSTTCSTNYNALSNDEMVAQSTVYRKVPSQAALEYNNMKKLLDAYVSGGQFNDPFHAIPAYITQSTVADVNTFNNLAKQDKLVAGTLYSVSCVGTNKKLEPTGILRNVGIYTDCEVSVDKDKDVSLLKPTKTLSGNNGNGNGQTKNLCDPDNSDCSQVDWDAEIPPSYTCDQALAAGYESYDTYLDTAAGNTYRDGVTTDTLAQPCAIEPGANGLWDNVFLFTTANETGDHGQASISFPNNMQIGRLDGCAEGGGARIYAGGSIATPSGTIVHGSHFILLGDAKLAAKASGTYGLTVEAGGDITYSAQGTVGGCPAGEPENASDVVVTARPVAIVD